MSERTRRVPRARLAFAIALLAVLPGCLTGAMWRGYAWPDPVVTEQLVDRRTTEVAGALVVLPPVLSNGLRWCDGEHAAPGRWWLSAKAGADAEFAEALLADPEFGEVQSARVEAVRRHAVGEVIENEATLELDLRLHDAAIGEAVPTADLSPAAAQVLATIQRNAYLLALDPGTHLPAVYRRCAERLPDVDLRRLVGEPFAVFAESWVFVDAEGRPAFRVGAADVALPPAADDEGAPLADQLAALREMSLLVRVRSGGGTTILRLRPDRLWLLSGLRVDGERCLHRSSWFLQAAPLANAAAPALDAPRIASTLRLREEHHQRTYHPVWVDGEFLGKVALTPFSLAADLVLGPGVGDLLRWLTGAPKPYEFPERSR